MSNDKVILLPKNQYSITLQKDRFSHFYITNTKIWLFMYCKLHLRLSIYLSNCLPDCLPDCLPAWLSIYLVLKLGERMDNKKGKLVIPHGKPQKNASQETKSWWVKDDINLTGITFRTCSASSCRNISFSETKNKKIKLFNFFSKKGYLSKVYILKTFYDEDLLDTIEEFSNTNALVT